MTVDPATGTVPCAIAQAILPNISTGDSQWCSCEAGSFFAAPARDTYSSHLEMACGHGRKVWALAEVFRESVELKDAAIHFDGL